MDDYWSDQIPCESPECADETHSRMDWHTLGMTCGRCNKHTGNNSQGHYWGLCKRLMRTGVKAQDAVTEFHFCCPDDCELAVS